MNSNTYILTFITISLLLLIFYKNQKTIDTFREFNPALEIDNDLIITDSIITGNKPFQVPTHNVDIDGKIVSDKFCLRPNSSDPQHLRQEDYYSNCLDYHDFKSIKDTPHHYPESLTIGNTTLFEEDFKNLKDIDNTINQHYFIPSKKSSYHTLPLSQKVVNGVWYPGDGNQWDDFKHYSSSINYDTNGNRNMGGQSQSIFLHKITADSI